MDTSWLIALIVFLENLSSCVVSATLHDSLSVFSHEACAYLNKRVTPYLQSTCENSFSMEHEVESLVPVSNSYLYQHRVGEMRENAKGQDGDHKMLSISHLKTVKLLFFLSFLKINNKSDVAGKY